MSRIKFAALILGSFAGVAAMGAANAATPDTAVPKQVVRFSEGSLATSDGVDQLYRRIVAAAKQVCPEASNNDLRALGQSESCRQAAVSRAIASIHNSQLAALSAGHSKNG
jgi:UrcA family protein